MKSMNLHLKFNLEMKTVTYIYVYLEDIYSKRLKQIVV